MPLFIAAKRFLPADVVSDSDAAYDYVLTSTVTLTLYSLVFLGEAYRAFSFLFFLFVRFPAWRALYVEGTYLTTSLRYQDSRLIFKSANSG